MAIVVAASGRRVLWLEPPFDPELLPRPFPQPNSLPWRGLWSAVAPPGAIQPRWSQFAGAVTQAFVRRGVPDPGYRHSLLAQTSGWEKQATDPRWAWAEPADGYPALAEFLGVRMQQVPIERRAWPGEIAIRRSWWKRSQVIGVDFPVRRWLLLFAEVGTAVRQDPELPPPCPRAGVQGETRWWSDERATVVHQAGPQPEGAPPGYAAAFAPAAHVDSPPPWGMTSGWALRIAQVPGPARVPPTVWAEWLMQQIAPLVDRRTRSALAK